MTNPLKTSLLILCAGLCLGLTAATKIKSSPATMPMADAKTYEGSVTGWSIDAAGTVSLRLEGSRSDKPFRLWFSTAANQSSTTHFEALVLDAILELNRHGTKDARVIVTSEGSSGSRGKSPADGLTLVALRRD